MKLIALIVVAFGMTRSRLDEFNGRRPPKTYPPRYTEWFFIKAVADPSMVLDVDGDAACVGSRVVFNPRGDSDSQLWKWSGHMLINKASGLALDIKGGLPGFEGLILYYPANTANQRWIMGDRWVNQTKYIAVEEMGDLFLAGVDGEAGLTYPVPNYGYVPGDALYYIEYQLECVCSTFPPNQHPFLKMFRKTKKYRKPKKFRKFKKLKHLHKKYLKK